MNYKKALKKLESLKEKLEAIRKGSSSEKTHEELVILYGKCEDIITKIIGVEKVVVPSSHGASETYSNGENRDWFSFLA